MTSIMSFDVFDTVLTRLSGSPRQTFVLAGRRLRRDGVISIDPQAYAAAREQALQDLTPNPGRHPTLEQVTLELASRLGLPAPAAQQLAAAELDADSEVLRAVPGASARVAAARQQTGRGVLYVSDTSMPAAFLEALLRREGLYLPGDELFTSAAQGSSKQQGQLFADVAQRLGVPPAQVSHVGDDRWSDLGHARLRGWTATHDASAALNHRERELDRHADITDGVTARFAGAARFGRLQARADGIDPGTASVAGSVALPLLAGFGLWVTRQAQLHDLDRLYFVARDGEVFRDVTSRLLAHAGSDVQSHYLYGSRRSWQLAAAGTAAHQNADDLWLPDDLSGAELSAGAALALADLDLDTARSLIDDPVLRPARGDVALGEHGWQRLRALLSDGPLAEARRQAARARRDVLVRYLDQEGLTGPGRVGLVDVGWTGRAARALEDVLLDAGRPLPAAHLFFGLLAPAQDLMGTDLRSRAHGWLIDENRGRPSRAGADDPVMMIESFAMGSEGNTLGFEQVGDRVVPLLRTRRNEAAQLWDFDGYRAALAAALDALCDGPPLDTCVDLRASAWRQLLSFWRSPSLAEARAWGAQPYGEDFANAHVHPLARAVTARRLLARLRLGPPGWREPTYWLAGTLRLSPAIYRYPLSLAGRAHDSITRVRRIPARLRTELVVRRGR